MSLSAGRYQIANAHKSLKQQWLSTEDSWRDEVRKDFENTYWDPLAVRMTALLTAIDRLDQIIATMRHDCE
jgi:hypothetical protein